MSITRATNRPPEEILNPPKYQKRNFEHIILWVLSNNDDCEWKYFTNDLNISQSTLSNYIKRLKIKGYVEQEKRGYYQITTKGKERFNELSREKETKRKLSYPPKAILKGRNYDDIILWMVYNNNYCKWSDFLEKPLMINQSSLSKNLNLLLDNNFVRKENKEYRITPSGKTEYSRVLKSYDLDRQSILEEESKRIEEITKRTIRFFEKYNIIDDDIKFRYLNNVLKMDYQKVKNTLDNEEDFNKVLLYISINHPNQYPYYISSEEFSLKYNLQKIILDFHVLQIVDKNLYSIKFFKLKSKLDKIYYFQANEKKEKILRAITEDYVTRLTYLKKLYENSMDRNYYLDMRYTGDMIIDEICDKLFDEGLREALREFLPEYINYLAYKIGSQKRLIDTYDKLEGIVWQNIHEEVESYNSKDVKELKRFIDWSILLIMDPYFSSSIEEIFNDIQPLIKDKKFKEAKEKIDVFLKKDPTDLNLIIFRVKVLCLLREYREVIKETSRVIKKSQNIKHDQLYTLYFFSLAYSHIGLGEYEKALSVSDKLDNFFPDHPISYATKAFVFGYNTLYEFDKENAGKDTVYDYIDKAIMTDKYAVNKARYYEFKSIILLNKELFDEALEAIDNGISLAPDIINLYIDKVKIMVHSSPPEYEKAIELLEEKIQDFPEKRMKLALKKASVLKLKGELEEGFELVKELTELEPDNAYYYNALAYFYLYMNDKENAIETAKKLIELAPNDGNSYDTFGEILMEFGYYEEAIEKFKKAIKIEPYGWFSFESHIKWGICLKEIGDYESALYHIDKGKTIANSCLCDFETRKSVNKKVSQHITEIEEIKKIK